MNKIFLGIGSNLGNREENLRRALTIIEDKIGLIVNSSGIYETEPWGFTSDEKFLNMAVELSSGISTEELMKEILSIESFLGRVRSDGGYISRSIDIDILFFGSLICDSPGLTIPHPRILERRFVLVPLCEIAPAFIHPVFNISVNELLACCKDTSLVVPYRIQTR